MACLLTDRCQPPSSRENVSCVTSVSSCSFPRFIISSVSPTRRRGTPPAHVPQACASCSGTLALTHSPFGWTDLPRVRSPHLSPQRAPISRALSPASPSVVRPPRGPPASGPASSGFSPSRALAPSPSGCVIRSFHLSHGDILLGRFQYSIYFFLFLSFLL